MTSATTQQQFPATETFGFAPQSYMDILTTGADKQRYVEEIGNRHYLHIWNNRLRLARRVAEPRVHLQQRLFVLSYREKCEGSSAMIYLAARQTVWARKAVAASAPEVSQAAWTPVEDLLDAQFEICQIMGIDGWSWGESWLHATVTPVLATSSADIGWYAYSPDLIHLGEGLGLLYDFAKRKSVAAKVPMPADSDANVHFRTTMHELVMEGSDNLLNYGLLFGVQSKPKKPVKRALLAKYPFDLPDVRNLLEDDAGEWYAKVLPQCTVLLDAEKSDSTRIEKALAIQHEILGIAALAVFDSRTIERFWLPRKIAPLEVWRAKIEAGELTQKEAETQIFSAALS